MYQYQSPFTSNGSPAQYIQAKDLIGTINLNGSVTQDEAEQAISGMLDLTLKQKAVLWQLQNMSWAARNNPYSASVGATIRAILQKGTAGKLSEIGLDGEGKMPTGRLMLLRFGG